MTKDEGKFINLIYTISNGFASCQTEKLREKEDRKGSYCFIPMYYLRLYQEIEDLLKINPNLRGKKFVDYGSGPGMTMLIAKSFGLITKGYEMRDSCVKFARSILTLNVEKCDLKSHPYNEKFQIVYYYCPFTDRNMENDFELKAISTLESGGYLMCPCPGTFLAGGMSPRMKKEFKRFEPVEGLSFTFKLIKP